jgi:DNA-binding transcriptional LysR family regulator
MDERGERFRRPRHQVRAVQSNGTAICDATTAACAAAGFTPRVAQLAPRITSTLGLVAAGMGAALVPASMRRIGVDGVVYRDFHECAGGKAVLGLASRHHDPSIVVKNFIASVRRLQQRSAG